MAYLKNYSTLSDVMQGTDDGRLVHVTNEFEHLMTLGADLPYVAGTGASEDVGVYEDDYVYNHFSKTGDLDSAVKTAKGGHTKRKDVMGLREGSYTTNRKTYDNQPNGKEWRTRQVNRMIRAIGLDWQHDMWYGNPVEDPNQFLGLYPRFDKATDEYGTLKTDSTTKSPYICLDAGGGSGKDGSLCSIFLLCPDETEGVSMFYPNPSHVTNVTSGVKFVSDDFDWRSQDGGMIEQAFDFVSIIGGLRIVNRHSCIRICNIDPTSDTSLKKAVDWMYFAAEIMPKNLLPGMMLYANGFLRANLKKYYNTKVTPATYDEAKPKNISGDFVFDNQFWFRASNDLLMTESHVAIA